MNYRRFKESWNIIENEKPFNTKICSTLAIQINSNPSPVLSIAIELFILFCRVIVGKLIYSLFKNFCATGEV